MQSASPGSLYVLILQTSAMVFLLYPGLGAALLKRGKQSWRTLKTKRVLRKSRPLKTARYHVIDMSNFK